MRRCRCGGGVSTTPAAAPAGRLSPWNMRRDCLEAASEGSWVRRSARAAEPSSGTNAASRTTSAGEETRRSSVPSATGARYANLNVVLPGIMGIWTMSERSVCSEQHQPWNPWTSSGREAPAGSWMGMVARRLCSSAGAPIQVRSDGFSTTSVSETANPDSAGSTTM